MNAGLVGQVTSATRRTLPTLSRSQALRELNNSRRIRRMRRVVIGTADASREALERGGFRFDGIFVTLTYRDEAFYSTRDVSEYIDRCRKWMKRRGVKARYQWVIELTKKGKPHYHVLWWVPKGTRLPKPDASGFWQKGSSRIERARKPVGYLVKYATKGEPAEFPRGARLFGCGAPDEAVKVARHRLGLPMWLYERSEGRCVRVARLGWVDKSTGVIHETPFLFSVDKDEWGFIVVTITLKECANASVHRN